VINLCKIDPIVSSPVPGWYTRYHFTSRPLSIYCWSDKWRHIRWV